MKSANRRRATVLTALAAAVVVAAVIVIVVDVTGSRTTPPGAEATVAKVNGIAIPTREFVLFLDQDRAGVFSYFQQHYSAQDSATFWTTSFAGQTPSERLKSVALGDVARTTVQLALASRYKLIPSAEYTVFLSAWTAENLRRKSAIANHQPIYGPQQYTEANYLTYAVGNLGFEVQDRLVADGTFDPSQANLQSYYLTHLADFSSGRIGPMPADFEFAKEQVRLGYLDAQYTKLIDRLAKSAAVTTTPNMRRLTESDCLSSGACFSQG